MDKRNLIIYLNVLMLALHVSSEKISPTACSSDEYTCFDASCINISQVCDDKIDCPGNSKEDELNCTISYLNNDTGVILFSNSSSDFEVCLWTVKLIPLATIISISFNEYNFEYQVSSLYKYILFTQSSHLKIKNGNDSFDKYCTPDIVNLNYSSDTIFISFISNGSLENSSLSLSETQVPPQICNSEEFECNNNGISCIKMSQVCDNIFDCPNKEDEVNCTILDNCNGYLNNDTGVSLFSNSPSDFEVCLWTIKLMPSVSIFSISFNNYNLEYHVSSLYDYTITTQSSIIKIKNGNDTFEEYCSPDFVELNNSSGNTIFISLVSNGSMEVTSSSLSDIELPATCSTNEFTCYDSTCINAEQVCDHTIDCPGSFKEDEINCTLPTVKIDLIEFELDIRCSLNCDLEHVNPSQTLNLQVFCLLCTKLVSYEWYITYFTSNEWNTLEEGNTTGLFSQDLLIKGSMLIDTKYRVQVKVTDGIYLANDSLSFSTNAPPTGGTCNSSALSGYALQDKFSFGCYNWYDDSSKILTYKFYYQVKGSSTKNLMLLTGKKISENNFLPNGKPEFSEQVDIIIYIYDEYSLSTLYTFAITVMEANFEDNSEEMVDLITELITMPTDDSDELDLGLITVITSLINNEADKSGDSQIISKEDRTKLKEEIMLSVSSSSSSFNTSDKIDQGASLINSLTEKPDEITDNAKRETAKALKSLAENLPNIADLATEDVVKICSDMTNGAGNVLAANLKNGSKIDNSVTDDLLNAVDGVATAISSIMSPGEDRIIDSSSLQLSLSKARKRDSDDKTMSSSSGAVINLPRAEAYLPNQPDSAVISSKLVALNTNPYADNSSSLLKSKSLSFNLKDDNGEYIYVNGISEQIILEIPNILSAPEYPIAIDSKDMLDEENYLHVITVINLDQESLILKLIDVKECKSGSNITISMYMNSTAIEYNYTDTQQCDPSLLNYSFKIPKEEFLFPDLYYINITQKNPINMHVQSFTARCRFWNESMKYWDDSGCEELKESTPEITQCGCNHLSTFASGVSFYPPESLNWAAVFAGFNNLGDNAAVFSTIFVVFGLYLFTIYFAYKADKKDREKWSATILKTENSETPYYYHLYVSTGSMGGATTMSRVYFILEGSESKTDAICMNKGTLAERKGFKRGSVRQFILETTEPLGILKKFRIWHDCSGKYAEQSWYLSRITVVDIKKKEKYYFVCERWLAVERDDGRVERLLKIALEKDLRQVKPMFSTNAHFSLSDSHLWFSVLSRPRKSHFTRVQRISCCLSLLYCTMVANCMWYQQTKQQGNDIFLQIGPIVFSWKVFQIGLMSSLMVLPINIIIIQLFRKSCPTDNNLCGCQSTDNGNKNNNQEEILKSLSDIDEEIITEDELKDRPQKIEMKRNKSAVSNMQSFSHSKERDFTKLLEDSPIREINKEKQLNNQRNILKSKLKCKSCHKEELMHSINSFKIYQSALNILDYQPEVNKENNENKTFMPIIKKRKKIMLPYWFIYIAWTLLTLSCLVSAGFTIFYSMQWGAEDSNIWLQSFFISLIEDVIVLQPIKILALAFIITIIFKKYEGDDEDESQTCIFYDESMSIETSEEPIMTKDVNSELLKILKTKRENEIQMIKLIKDIIIYVIFLSLLWFIAYGTGDKNAVFFNKSINETLFDNKDFNKLNLGFDPFYNWVEKYLLPKLFTTVYYNGMVLKIGDNTLFGDYCAYRIGSPRLRQIRVKDVCLPKTLSELATHCTVEYSTSNEDRADYGKKWLPLNPNDTFSHPEIWHYKDNIELDGLPINGFIDRYPAGGYVADLGTTYTMANETLSQIWNNNWLDSFTRALIIEFNLYNPSINLFGSVRVILEYPNTGGAFTNIDIDILRLSNYVGSLWVVLVIIELIFVAFLLYYIIKELLTICKEKIAYFSSFWNFFEILKICACVLAIVYYIFKFFTQLAYLKEIEEMDPNKFVNLQKIAFYDEMYRCMMAIVVFFSTLKIWNMLKFNKKMRIMSITLSKASGQIITFFLIFFVVFFAFGNLFYFTVGTKLLEYHHIWLSIQTLFGMWLGNFDFNSLKNTSKIVGPIAFFLFVFFVYMILALIFVTIIVIAFDEVRYETRNLNNEYEVLKYFKNSLKSIFGMTPDNDQDIDQLIEESEKGVSNKRKALIYVNNDFDIKNRALKRRALRNKIAKIQSNVNCESRENKLSLYLEYIHLVEMSSYISCKSDEIVSIKEDDNQI